MANEITVKALLSYVNSAFNIPTESLGIDGVAFTITGKLFVKGTVSVGIAESAIPLGGIGSLGWGVFKNNDPTNFVSIRVGTGGSKIIKLKPGECAVFRFGVDITAPYWIADTAACIVDYMILEN